jgi:hypothetical protein
LVSKDFDKALPTISVEIQGDVVYDSNTELTVAEETTSFAA